MKVSTSRTEVGLKIMFTALSKYDLSSIARAVMDHIAHSSYPIKPSDIVEAIEGNASEKSLLAWEVFKSALEHHDAFESIAFPDAAIHFVIMRMGGWIRLANELYDLTDRELEFRSKAWRQLYEVGLKVASWTGEDGKVRVPAYFVGESEVNNRQNGYSLEHTPIKNALTHERLDRPKMEALQAATLQGIKAPELRRLEA